jgi:hypothetical protein
LGLLSLSKEGVCLKLELGSIGLERHKDFHVPHSGTALRVSTEIQCTVPISNFVAPNLKVEVAIDTPEATD